MIPKQDRQGVRKPMDIEQKYDLNTDFSEIEKIATEAKTTASIANTRAREALEEIAELDASTDTRFAEVDADISELGESVAIHSENIINLDERLDTLEKSDLGGEDGATFTPSVDSSGNLSWTNDKGLDNPATVNIKGGKGDKGDTGANGVSCTHSWNGTTLTVTSSSGTSSANLKGETGVAGSPGADGKDGVSVTHSWNGTTLIVTSASGTSSADLKGEKGDTGATGSTGSPGTAGKDGVSCTHSWSGTTLTVTSASGTSSANLKGEKGDKGDPGALDTSVLNNYLPLSGGTIASVSGDTPLNVKSANAIASYIGFKRADDTTLGYFGFSGKDVPVAYLSSGAKNLALAADVLPLSGGKLTGNLSGQYITGTWLQSTANNHLGSTPPKICVQDASGWVYHRTLAELASDLGVGDGGNVEAMTVAQIRAICT